MPNYDEDVYVLYMIMGEGEEYTVELATEEAIRDIAFFKPSESYLLLPRCRI